MHSHDRFGSQHVLPSPPLSPFTAGAEGCPEDGRFYYNTLVALDKDGALRAVYHKSHLFGTSPVLDQPAQPTAVTFQLGDDSDAFGLVRYDDGSQQLV